MILTVDELKKYITINEPDEVLEAKLQALENLIRKQTNNTFERRAYRKTADIVGGLFNVEAPMLFKAGDTVQIRGCGFNEGLYTIETTTDSTFTVKGYVVDEENVVVTKVEYPMDVKMGVINMLKWDIENRAKVGIQSETVSRHSVTYFNMDGDNSTMGFPKSLLGFLKPYKKARF